MREKRLKVLVDHKLLPRLKYMNLKFSEDCIYGKKSRHKFKTRKHVSKGIFDYIHSYLRGPSPEVSFGGSSYFVTFIDEYSRTVWIYLVKIKADVFDPFKEYRALVQKNTRMSIKCLRIENGTNFTSKEFESYC